MSVAWSFSESGCESGCGGVRSAFGKDAACRYRVVTSEGELARSCCDVVEGSPELCGFANGIVQPAIGRLFGTSVFKRNQRCCEPGDRSKRIPTGSRMQWNSGSNSSLRACVEVYPRPAHRVACVVSQGVPAWWLYFSVLNAQAQLLTGRTFCRSPPRVELQPKFSEGVPIATP